MNIGKTISISRHILLLHKGRTALSLSGIIIGICALLLMVAIGKGTEAKLIAQINQMGSNLLIVSAGQVKVIAGRARQTRRVTTLEEKDARSLLAKSTTIRSAVPAQSKKLAVKYGNLGTKTTVVGSTEEILVVRNFQVAAGRFFAEDENRGGRRVAVLGQTVVDNIFEGENPLGAVIRIGRVPFEVIGVLAKKGLDINGSDQDDQILIPLKTGLRRLFNLSYINTIYLQARSEQSMEEAGRESRQILREEHHLRGNKPDDFTIQNQATVLQTQQESSQTFTLLISSIAAVSLLVGGIGILAVMLISIRERIQEIGIRMAVGAKKRDIRLQFLAESILLSFVGGLIGIVFGLTMAAVTAYLADWPFILPINIVLTAFLLTMAMGIVFGVYPAQKAASMDPIKALQFE